MPEQTAAPFLEFEDEQLREIPLISGSVWRIGRTEDNAIMLESDSVSRSHALIQKMDGGEFYLIDMGSRNGSFVNGRRLTAPVVLRDGDHLAFGQRRLFFRNPSEAPADNPNSANAVNTFTGGQTIAFFKPSRVSILVVDLRGFTTLAQKTDPAVLSRVLSAWFAGADRITHGHGGIAQKHIGDAVMAVWTHNAEAQEHGEILRSLSALSEISQMTDRLHDQFNLLEPLRIGAGLNTGLAVLGDTGFKGASDFTAIGDSVNLAFRLESATKELGADLVLGATTFEPLRRLPYAVLCFRASEAVLKGYDAPVQTWHTTFSDLTKFLSSQRKNPTVTIGAEFLS